MLEEPGCEPVASAPQTDCYECEVDAVELKCSPSMLCEVDETLQLAATASRLALALESASLQVTGHIALAARHQSTFHCYSYSNMPCRLYLSSDFTATVGFPETRIFTVSSQSAEGEFERKVSWETA